MKTNQRLRQIRILLQSANPEDIVKGYELASKLGLTIGEVQKLKDGQQSDFSPYYLNQ